MLVCSQLALLVSCALGSGAPEPTTLAPAADPSAAVGPRAPLVAAGLEPLVALAAQGTVDMNPPLWFVSVSGYTAQSDFFVPATGSGSDDFSAFGIDVGYTNWNDQLGITIEGGFLGSTSEAETGLILTPNEDIETQRYLVGLRLFDRGSDWWLPYLRGGYMWRSDKADTVSDDGHGFYVGGGFDFFLGRNLRIGPQILYTDSESLDTTEWLLGGVLSFGF